MEDLKDKTDESLLINALQEPIEELILVEVPSRAKGEDLIRLARALSRDVLGFSIDSSRPAIELLEEVSKALGKRSGDALAETLVVLLDSQSNVQDQHKALEFWRQMNLLRERWGALPGQKIFLVLPATYHVINQVALHLKSWFGLKLHLMTDPDVNLLADQYTIGYESRSNWPNSRNSGLRLNYDQYARPEDALTAYDGFLALPNLSAREKADILVRKALALEALGREQEDSRSYEDLLAIPDAPSEQEASILVSKGFTLRQLGRTEEALLAYDELLAMPDAPSALRAFALDSKAFALRVQGQCESAITVYESLLREPLGRVEDRASGLHQWRITLARTFNWEGVDNCYEDLVPLPSDYDQVLIGSLSKISKDKDQGGLSNQRGKVRSHLSMMTSAVAVDDLGLARQLGNSITLDLATTRATKAALVELANWFAEFKELRSLIGKSQVSTDPSESACAQFWSGLVALSDKQIVEAESYFLRFLEMAQRRANRNWMMTGLLELGSIAQAGRNYDRAERLIRGSLGISIELGNQRAECLFTEQLALLADERGDTFEAGRLHERSLSLTRELGLTRLEAVLRRKSSHPG